MRCWKQWEFTKCPRSTIESINSNQGQCLKSLDISKEAFYVLKRIKSENWWKWNNFKTVIYLPLSKHFPAAWSLPQNTAYFVFFPDFSHLIIDSDHFFRNPWIPPTFFPAVTLVVYHIPIKIREKKQCFDSTLGKRAYKDFEWEAKFVWVTIHDHNPVRFILFRFFRSRSRVPVRFRSMLDRISWRVDTKANVPRKDHKPHRSMQSQAAQA